ncbi:MAG: transketolase [Nitrospirae bacterium]|nr:MAG: transketolase [Nitrospirota bacterium]
MRHNNDLRRTIVEMVYRGRDGHIPSAFSILDIVQVLYERVLRVDPRSPNWPHRDYFILSKGHGCLALYVVLERLGFLSREDLDRFCRSGGILGEHPDCTQVPGVEASTGSLGHGFPFAVGIAYGLRLRQMPNRVIVLVGDGECHEGTIWEAAHVAANLRLGNLCVIVDWNGSAAQLLPQDDLPLKWNAFGWSTRVIDGHSQADIVAALQHVSFQGIGTPSVLLAKTIKGKGVPFLEGHGHWHHRIPDEREYQAIMEALA